MKYEVPNWLSALSEQAAKGTGCIPWSFEWMLRLAGATCDFPKFQKEFDLQAQGKAANHFSNVAAAVSARYPTVEFKWQGFPKGEGKKKIEEMKKRVTAGALCAYSLSLIVNGQHVGWHIMPVIALSDNDFTLVFAFEDATRNAALLTVPDTYAAHLHDTIDGGDDFAWLAKH